MPVAHGDLGPNFHNWYAPEFSEWSRRNTVCDIFSQQNKWLLPFFSAHCLCLTAETEKTSELATNMANSLPLMLLDDLHVSHPLYEISSALKTKTNMSEGHTDSHETNPTQCHELTPPAAWTPAYNMRSSNRAPLIVSYKNVNATMWEDLVQDLTNATPPISNTHRELFKLRQRRLRDLNDRNG